MATNHCFPVANFYFGFLTILLRPILYNKFYTYITLFTFFYLRANVLCVRTDVWVWINSATQFRQGNVSLLSTINLTTSCAFIFQENRSSTEPVGVDTVDGRRLAQLPPRVPLGLQSRRIRFSLQRDDQVPQFLRQNRMGVRLEITVARIDTESSGETRGRHLSQSRGSSVRREYTMQR